MGSRRRAGESHTHVAPLAQTRTFFPAPPDHPRNLRLRFWAMWRSVRNQGKGDFRSNPFGQGPGNKGAWYPAPSSAASSSWRPSTDWSGFSRGSSQPPSPSPPTTLFSTPRSRGAVQAQVGL